MSIPSPFWWVGVTSPWYSHSLALARLPYLAMLRAEAWRSSRAACLDNTLANWIRSSAALDACGGWGQGVCCQLCGYAGWSACVECSDRRRAARWVRVGGVYGRGQCSILGARWFLSFHEKHSTPVQYTPTPTPDQTLEV